MSKALLKPSEPMATSGTLDDARNRPNKIVPRFALAYEFRLRTHTRTKNFKARATMQRRRREAGAVYAECRSGHARFGAPRPRFCFGAVCKAGVRLHRTHCMATQNPSII